ncbi:TPA: capsular polysaccharide synthesis protein, partial [Escherichia coli]
QEIIDKFNNGIIGYTAFSEIIRIELLSIYGGIWMDSTVYIHKAIEETLLEKEFLTLKGVEKLRPGKHLGLIPVYFIGCESNYPPILKVRDYLLSYWIHNDKQIDYFL